MSFFDSLLPDLNDPNSMAAWGGIGNMLIQGGQPHHISNMGAGNALAMLAGAGMQGAAAGAGGAQQYQQQNLVNQMGQLGLQRQQAIQPYQINMIKNMMGGQNGSAPGSMAGGGASGIGSGPGGALTSADQLGMQALMAAYGSGDMKQISTAYLSLYEHNPALAGAIKQKQEENAVHETPNGPRFGISGMPGASGSASFGAPAPVMPPPVSGPQQLPPVSPQSIPPMNASALQAPPGGGALPPPPMPSQIPPSAQLGTPPPRDFAAMPPQGQPPAATPPAQSPYMAMDGKPLIPGIQNAAFYKPDPQKTPDFLPNTGQIPTTTEVTYAKDQTDLATKQYEGLGTAMQSLSNEKYYADRMAEIYKDMSSPNAEAEWPEIAKKAFNLSIITDPSRIKNLSDVQEAINTGAKAVLSNIKDTSAGLDPNHPMRIFGSEVTANMETAIDPSLTPTARYNSLMTAQGLINRNMEAIKSYNSPAVGGLGNRLNGGKTMPPSEYLQQFIGNHDARDYRQQVVNSTPPFKGMGNDKQNQAPHITYKRVNGKMVAQ